MKKVIAFLLVFLMCTGLLASAHAVTVSAARSKISDDLWAAFDGISSNETVTAIVETTDVDHDVLLAPTMYATPKATQDQVSKLV